MQMDGDHAPRALHAELHQETRGGEGGFGGGQDPRGDQAGGKQRGEDDGVAAAEPLAEVADDGAADTGAGFHEDGAPRGGGVEEFFLREEEGRVTVLGGVGVLLGGKGLVWETVERDVGLEEREGDSRS